ncbi:ribosylglycohydrolase [Streptomyces chrestomyceticus JCM 4735]|uniref:Ribosylglycohydrolase n=1 Tax=Streptomyces chrestomyceticus JCM 4735 TaxID=1306181 RepID=A0A7U9L222_9ACTN|nr:ribosylglycohydrolase [Streptomyces chrestomyceticus JCM 4735]
MLTAATLLERGRLDLPGVFRRFRRWAAAEPKDIGLRTEDVLGNGEPWGRAAAGTSRSTGAPRATVH